ncbi:hypothetical protein I302_108030 [Kwoniella bestiolae CBS 10118]|uniref:Uncharacterized protein n=1 Tax=Kwoniella bestiolae CBS 10118 TaxID=1296100 RepID=A0A1B9FWW3_9TREE|nr:hypothetical protein I302_07604 [Kwoniella bestiolae CBS 10118]OCF23250.1 hypothetical protein I302_07604 [Kwoniella bestiolae CBS 10118]
MSQQATQTEEQDSFNKFARIYVWYIVGGVIVACLLIFFLHLVRLQKRGRMAMWGLESYRHCAECHKKGPGGTGGWKGGEPGSVMCFKTKQYYCGRSKCTEAPRQHPFTSQPASNMPDPTLPRNNL